MAERYEIHLGSQAEFAMLAPMKPTLATFPLPAARARPWWLWPNLLSLDAPLVALAWQEAWAHCLAVELGWSHRALLGLATWLAYCGDRLLDARRLEAPADSPRHEFARRHALLLCRVWLAGLAAVVVLGLRLPLREILWGAVMLAGVGGYFLVHHWERTRALAGAVKELMAGVVFAVGAVFFVAVQIPFSWAFALALLAWGGLCAMNCLAIACWDRARDAAMGQHSLARCWVGAGGWLWLWAVAVMGLAAAAWILDARLGPLAGALLVGALALGEVARGGADDRRRVLADAVLLSPIIFLW